MRPLKTIITYHAPDGSVPLYEWLNSLEKRTYAIIVNRIKRLNLGNLGDCKSIGDDIFELRIHYGPGFRVYFSRIGNIIILLINGGSKNTQSNDIKKAKQYLNDYKSRTKGN